MINTLRYAVAIIISFLVDVQVSGQQKAIALNRFVTGEIERSIAHKDSANHTGIKPFVESRINLQTVTGFSKDSSKYYYPLTAKIFRDNLFHIQAEDFNVTVDPLFDFSFTNDFADTTDYADTVNLWNNSRGLRIEGDIGKTISFQTTIFETQSYFPAYLKAITDSLGVVPGMGRPKAYHVAGFDYGISTGLLSAAITPWLHFQFGHGKNFVGHGYRSLLLSDASFNYPFAKATAYFLKNKLQYSIIYAQLQSLEKLPLGEVPEPLFQKKVASFHYLSWLASSRLELGLFEAIIWQRWDSTGVQPLNYGAYIPVIGLNTGLQGFASENNVLVGLNAKFKLNNHAYVYGQYMADDPSTDATGYQAGIRYFDCLLKNLDLQVEYNSIGKNSYANSIRLQNYAHFNQPIGHPSGGCSREMIGILNYRYRRFITQLKFNQSWKSGDPMCNWNSNPEGEEALILYAENVVQQFDINTGFYLNPKTNARLLLGFTDRLDFGGRPTLHTSMVYVVFRTDLINRYFDF